MFAIECKITFDNFKEAAAFFNAAAGEKIEITGTNVEINPIGLTPKETVLPPSYDIDGGQPSASMRYHNKMWTTFDDEYIIENYTKMKSKEISERLGRTPGSIVARAHILAGLGKMKLKWSRKDRTLKIRMHEGNVIHLGSEGISLR